MNVVLPITSNRIFRPPLLPLFIPLPPPLPHHCLRHQLSRWGGNITRGRNLSLNSRMLADEKGKGWPFRWPGLSNAGLSDGQPSLGLAVSEVSLLASIQMLAFCRAGLRPAFLTELRFQPQGLSGHFLTICGPFDNFCKYVRIRKKPLKIRNVSVRTKIPCSISFGINMTRTNQSINKS